MYSILPFLSGLPYYSKSLPACSACLLRDAEQRFVNKEKLKDKGDKGKM